MFAEQIRAEKDWTTRWQQERGGGDGGLGADEGMAVVRRSRLKKQGNEAMKYM